MAISLADFRLLPEERTFEGRLLEYLRREELAYTHDEIAAGLNENGPRVEACLTWLMLKHEVRCAVVDGLLHYAASPVPEGPRPAASA